MEIVMTRFVVGPSYNYTSMHLLTTVLEVGTEKMAEKKQYTPVHSTNCTQLT